MQNDSTFLFQLAHFRAYFQHSEPWASEAVSLVWHSVIFSVLWCSDQGKTGPPTQTVQGLDRALTSAACAPGCQRSGCIAAGGTSLCHTWPSRRGRSWPRGSPPPVAWDIFQTDLSSLPEPQCCIRNMFCCHLVTSRETGISTRLFRHNLERRWIQYEDKY